MTIVERTNDFDDDRPPLEFGVEWDRTNSGASTNPITRIGDSSAMAVDTTMKNALYSTYDSSFDDYLPWSGMRRMQMTIQGDVYSDVATELISRSINEYADAPVVTRVPFFFHKLEIDTPATNKWRYWISPYPLKGYAIHPAFTHWNSDNTKLYVTDVYVGSYEANVTASGYNAPLKCSLAYLDPSNSATRAAFRTLVQSMGVGTNVSGFHLLDWRTWNALQWLYLIEYGFLNSQAPSGSTADGGLSEGITRAGTNKTTRQLTGWTSSYSFTDGTYSSHNLGNQSGQVRCDTDSGGNPVWACSYRGIENLWGNTWTTLDGICINGSKQVWIVKDVEDFSDYAQGSAPYYVFDLTKCENTGMTFPADTTPWTNMKYPGNTTKGSSWMFGNWVTGAWDGLYCADGYYGITWTPGTTACSALVGGAYNSSLYGGIWALYPWTYASTHASVGTRIMQVPIDSNYWKIKI